MGRSSNQDAKRAASILILFTACDAAPGRSAHMASPGIWTPQSGTPPQPIVLEIEGMMW